MQELLASVNSILAVSVYPALTGTCAMCAALIALGHPPLLGVKARVVIAGAAAFSFAWLSLVAANKVPLPTLYSQLLARTVWTAVLVILLAGIARLLWRSTARWHNFQERKP
jgi:hypothetical protein